MQYGKVQGIDHPVSRLVMGTMIINSKDEEKCFHLLDAVFERGCNTFDTAHIYAGGDSERTMGRWMESRGNREKVVVIGKGSHHNQDRPRVTPFDITSDLHDTLARLRTDYVDLYLLHRDDPGVPVGPIVEALNGLREAGRIRAFGGSNWSHERIQEANDFAASHGLVPFAASSPNFSLAVQKEIIWDGCVSLAGPENSKAREWYAETRMPVFAWSSLGRGFLSGRFSKMVYETEKDNLDPSFVRAFCFEENFQRLDRAVSLAKEKEVSVPQIALAYVLNQPLEIHALVGAETSAEFEGCCDALDIGLSPAELAWLNLESDER